MQKLNAPGILPDPEDDMIEDELTADEVALVAFQGLLASGKYDPAAAAGAAWLEAVPEFFRARAEFPTMMEKLYGAKP